MAIPSLSMSLKWSIVIDIDQYDEVILWYVFQPYRPGLGTPTSPCFTAHRASLTHLHHACGSCSPPIFWHANSLRHRKPSPYTGLNGSPSPVTVSAMSWLISSELVELQRRVSHTARKWGDARLPVICLHRFLFLLNAQMVRQLSRGFYDTQD